MFYPESESNAQIQPSFSLPAQDQEVLRVILLGDSAAIRDMIHTLAVNRITDPYLWSPLTPTGRDREYIAIQTKRNAPDKA